MQIVHWFNPVLWFGLKRMCGERELARGGSVDSKACGATILKLVKGLGRTRTAPGLVGISTGKVQLKRRIRMIATYRRPTHGSMTVRALLLLGLGLVSLTDARAMREEAAPAPNPTYTTQVSSFNAGPDAIRSKLSDIFLDEVEVDGVPLPKVLKILEEASIQHDPARRGVPFFCIPLAPTSGPTIDPTIGALLPPADLLDMNTVVVHLLPPLRNARLADVLEAVTRCADKPIQYRIEASGVVFTQKPPGDSVPLETRVFRVDTNGFAKSLRSAGFVAPGNSERDIPEMVRDFVRGVGVNVWPPNAVYFSDRKGVLMVRATPHELDALEHAIETISGPPPQISMGMRVVELTPADSKELGFDWFSALGEVRPDSNDSSVAPIDKTSISAGHPATRGQSTVVMGILTEPQFKTVLHALAGQSDVQMTHAPPVIIPSGQRIRTSVTTKGGTTLAIDCLPRVGADSHRVGLALTVSRGGTEAAPSRSPEASTAVPQPGFATRAVVWDGQTTVISGLWSQEQPKDQGDVTETRNKVFVFVTVTILDPTGADPHPEAYFDPNSIPPQD